MFEDFPEANFSNAAPGRSVQAAVITILPGIGFCDRTQRHLASAMALLIDLGCPAAEARELVLTEFETRLKEWWAKFDNGEETAAVVEAARLVFPRLN